MMLRRILCRMDPIKRILKPDSTIPTLAYGQIMESSWLKQMRQLSHEIEQKQASDVNAKQASQAIETNPYYSKYADRIKKKQIDQESKPVVEKTEPKPEPKVVSTSTENVQKSGKEILWNFL